jgi:hypothetical protein
MGVQAAEIGLAEFHQDFVCGPALTGILQVVRFADRVGVEIIRVPSWYDLFHLESLPGSAGDNRLVLLAPVVIVRGPGALVLELERHQPKDGNIEPR